MVFSGAGVPRNDRACNDFLYSQVAAGIQNEAHKGKSGRHFN